MKKDMKHTPVVRERRKGRTEPIETPGEPD